MATENGESGLAQQNPTKAAGLGAEPTADSKGKGKAVAADADMNDAPLDDDEDDDEEEDGVDVRPTFAVAARSAERAEHGHLLTDISLTER